VTAAARRAPRFVQRFEDAFFSDCAGPSICFSVRKLPFSTPASISLGALCPAMGEGAASP
jgi:hypothetical protein